MVVKILFVGVIYFYCSTSLQASTTSTQSSSSFNSSESREDDLYQRNFDHTLPQILEIHNKMKQTFLNVCECSDDTLNNADNLDCSDQTSSDQASIEHVSTLWIPPVSVMPERPEGFQSFNLKLLTSSDHWCPSNIYESINVSMNSTEINIPTILDVQGALQIFDGITKLNKSTYCIIRKKQETIIKICKDGPTSSSPSLANISNYVKKCCAHDQIMDGKIMDGNNPKTCITVVNKTQWFPVYYRNGHKLHHQGVNLNHHRLSHHSENGSRILKSTSETPTEILYGFPPCKSYIIQSFLDNKFPNLQENGDVVLVDENKAAAPKKKYTKISAGQFCIDGIYIADSPTRSVPSGENQSLDDINPQLLTYSGSEWHQGIVVCTPISEETVVDPPWTLPIYAAVNHTAALFLLLTAVVYVLLWSHHNIHGWLQFAYCLSLFFAFSFLAIVQVWSQVFIENWPTLCFNLGWLIHFSILSSFFWLTSMNFDLFWRFSGRRYLLRIRSKPCRENVKKFVGFAVFSVGLPVLITGTAVLLDKMFDQQQPDSDIWIRLPRFGVKKCYFHDKKSQFPFLYLPIGVLLLINLLFFSSTVVQLRKIHSNTELARSHSTLQDKKGVRLIAKLFIVMGVLWTFEFVSWAASIAFPGQEEVLIWLFMPTEILNSLQGIAIFVIFICKPNVLSQLSAKFGSLRCRQ